VSSTLSQSSQSQSAWTSSDRTFLLRRLHSLTGVVPLGGFLLFHLFENASARRSPEAFNEVVLKISQMPYLVVLEWVGLLLPLIFHAVYGIYIAAPATKNAALTFHWTRHWAYIAQRVTGVIAFAYLVVHVVGTRFWSLFVKGTHIEFSDMTTILQTPGMFVFYLIGILSVIYHFSNGLWSFAITWGIVTSQAAQERLATVTMVLFFILSVVGIDILSAFVFPQSIIKSILGI
jgi:succinate dehydrogenase / fumarate reductase, cytochrome b subunit